MAAVSPGSTTDQDHTSSELQQRDPYPRGIDQHGVDPHEEPSVEWGWHGSFPIASRIAGWITAASMFLMLIGNHEGTTENWWLIGIGSILVVLLVGDTLSRRKLRR